MEQSDMTTVKSAQSDKRHISVRANTKVTIQSSEAKPYDKTASPALVEIYIDKTFSGDIDGEGNGARAWRSYAMINLPAWSACNASAESSADARALSCCKVQKPSRTARSRRHGLLFSDREQVIFLGCAARAALKVALEKGPKDGLIIGLNNRDSFENRYVRRSHR